MAIETEFAELQASRRRPAIGADDAARRGSDRRLYLVAIYGVLIVAGIIAIVPFLYVVSTSLKETASLFSYPPEWIPSEPTLTNFRNLLEDHPFFRWTLNSLIVASAVTVIKVVIDSMAGYAFAKMSFPGRDALFLVVLMTLMVPFAATLIPLFIIVRDLNLTNTYLGSDPAGAGESDRHLHDAAVHRVAAERSRERGPARRLLASSRSSAGSSCR